MAKGKNKSIEHINDFGKKVKGNDTEIDFYKNSEQAFKHAAIKGFEYQKKIELIPGITDNCGKQRVSTKHTLDFLIYPMDGDPYIVDTKGSGGMKSHSPKSLLVRKMYMHKYKQRYFMISKLPKYLGGHWVDSTPNYDLLNAIKKLYRELYPWVQRWKKGYPTMDIKEINEYYTIKAVDRLFYTSDLKLKKKPVARPKSQMELDI